jgi:hypothetical protein
MIKRIGDDLQEPQMVLPAHQTCNKFTERDEEDFRDFLAAAIPPDHPMHGVWAKGTWKSINRPAAKGRKMRYYRGIVSRRVIEQGNVVRHPVATTLRQGTANRVLAKIVKGLFAEKTGEVLGSELVWWLFGDVPAVGETVPLRDSIRLHDVLDVRWERDIERPWDTTWTLRFYGVKAFLVASTASSVPPTDAVRLRWPGPGRRT